MDSGRVTNKVLYDALMRVESKVDILGGAVADHDTQIAMLEKNHGLLSGRMDKMEGHDTSIALLERDRTNSSGRIHVLEEREREGAIERTKNNMIAALIGGAIAVSPQIIAQITQFLASLR
jgi:hypothetical protein